MWTSRAAAFLFLTGAAALAQNSARQFDVVVYEATPGGIAAAISAARLGHTVALIESQGHIGGMSTSGLGKSDVETRAAIGGLFREFVGRVYQDYVKVYGAGHENVKLCRDGYYYEPSVAERIFKEMIAAESRITLLMRWRLEEVVRSGNRVTAIRIRNTGNGELTELRAKVFIDGTYEGDLAAYAGAEYRVGRESRNETNELYAGVVYMDYETKAFLPGTTGDGDKRIQAYTYRLCLTDDPANSYVLKEPPPGYDRNTYLGYIDDWKAGRMGPPKAFKEGVGYYPPTYNTVVRALSIAPIPNHKYDVNINPRPLGFPFGGENYDYPDADGKRRDEIAKRHRNLTLGLLYFLQNDPDVPPEQRQLARRYQLPKDEFTDTGHFPWQLYVREARRLTGVATLSEHDLFVGPELGRTRLHSDSIAAGEYPIDSFPTRKREPGHNVALEGYVLMMDKMTHPYQIPYGIIVPKTMDGLLVPVAASTTHIAFGSIRLEPTWMTLGQAAGVAAHFAIRDNVAARSIRIDELQRELIREGQVLTYFKDIDKADPSYAALQYFGTKGFFRDYLARSHDKLDRATARKWLKLISPKSAATAQNSSEAGDFTGAEFRSALAATGASKSETISDGPLTRGEFCRLLYGVKWERQ
jgi:hypothetical protein